MTTRPLDPLPDARLKELRSLAIRCARTPSADVIALIDEVLAVRAARAGRDATPDRLAPDRLAEMLAKRHHDHDVDEAGAPKVCLWCGKPWPCVDYVDAMAVLAGRDARATPEPEPQVCCVRCGGSGCLPAKKGPLPVCPDCKGTGEESAP